MPPRKARKKASGLLNLPVVPMEQEFVRLIQSCDATLMADLQSTPTTIPTPAALLNAAPLPDAEPDFSDRFVIGKNVGAPYNAGRYARIDPLLWHCVLTQICQTGTAITPAQKDHNAQPIAHSV